MSLNAFRRALDALSEPVCCEGTAPLTERLAIALPDGDLGAIDDPEFVKWLVAHSEVAPFGKGGKTTVDRTVRDAHRLAARGRARIGGFDPAAILGEIETALSPREHLEASLTDVLVYRTGGHFARHKDTPRDADLVGTLVVGLPIEHRGGQFEIGEDHTIDWSGKPDPARVRWVALFGDVDHEVMPVTSGSRVTLVYSLSRTNRLRTDHKRIALVAKLAETIALPSKGDALMIACARQIIAETPKQGATQSIDSLRGLDREIASVLTDHGFVVSVRACVLAAEATEPPFGRNLFSIARLKKPLPPKVIKQSVVTFGDSAGYEGEDIDATCLAPYILDHVPMERWVIRKNAGTTLIHEADMFSDDGYFGNEGYEAHIYTLAALEVTRGKTPRKKKPAVKANKPAAKAKKSAAKAKTLAKRTKTSAANKKPRRR